MRAVRPVLVLASSLAAATAAAAVTTTVTACSSPGPARAGHPRQATPPASYYLSLGDSLSQGVQPNSSGDSTETRDGYADQLYAMLRRHHPGLRLVKLGCPGETTATMINGGMCRYPGGSQLAAADRFLSRQRGRVRLITIDIGANDPDPCMTQPAASKMAECALRSVPQATVNLAKILANLRQAAPGTRIVAMNYYLPALAAWRNGLAGQALARLSELAAAGYNVLLTRVYRSFGVSVADVFGAFHTADFGYQPAGPGSAALPRNVAAICQWTWECAAPPRGPNEHPNGAGYTVIAHSFLAAGAGSPPPS